MSGTRLRWRAERFYWGLLDAPQWKRCGELPPGLLPLLEEDLPVSADTLHAIGVPLADGRLLACGANCEALDGLPEGTLVLSPESLPEFVPGPLDPESLNLLVGTREPRSLRRERIKGHLGLAAALLAMAMLLSAGFLRRAWLWEGTAGDARVTSAAAVERAFPGRPRDLLAMELARTIRLSEAAAKVKPPADASLALESLLRVWPRAVSSKPQSVAITESGAVISVAVEGDATPFLKAMRPPPGWSIDEPRLNVADTLTRLTLQLRPLARGGGTP